MCQDIIVHLQSEQDYLSRDIMGDEASIFEYDPETALDQPVEVSAVSIFCSLSFSQKGEQETLREREREQKRKRKERKNQPRQGIYHEIKRNNHPSKIVTSI